MYDAATRIQAAARRWLAYKRRNQLLWTRETTERKEAIARMQVEMERLQDELGETSRVRAGAVHTLPGALRALTDGCTAARAPRRRTLREACPSWCWS